MDGVYYQQINSKGCMTFGLCSRPLTLVTTRITLYTLGVQRTTPNKKVWPLQEEKQPDPSLGLASVTSSDLSSTPDPMSTPGQATDFGGTAISWGCWMVWVPCYRGWLWGTADGTALIGGTSQLPASLQWQQQQNSTSLVSAKFNKLNLWWGSCKNWNALGHYYMFAFKYKSIT